MTSGNCICINSNKEAKGIRRILITTKTLNQPPPPLFSTINLTTLRNSIKLIDNLCRDDFTYYFKTWKWFDAQAKLSHHLLFSILWWARFLPSNNLKAWHVKLFPFQNLSHWINSHIFNLILHIFDWDKSWAFLSNNKPLLFLLNEFLYSCSFGSKFVQVMAGFPNQFFF